MNIQETIDELKKIQSEHGNLEIMIKHHFEDDWIDGDIYEDSFVIVEYDDCKYLRIDE